MKTYDIGEVYEVHTPYNNGIYKVVSVVNNTVFYKGATPYFGSGSFPIGSNFCENSKLLSDKDILMLRDEIANRLLAI